MRPQRRVGDTAYGTASLLGWTVNDRYLCPAGKATGEDTIFYRACKYDCECCALKPACCPNTPARQTSRSIHAQVREVARSISRTPAYRDSRPHRKKVEMLFAYLKRILKLDRFRLRGLSGAQDELCLLPQYRICGEWRKALCLCRVREVLSPHRSAGAAGKYASYPFPCNPRQK
jgi:hypothetical protein